MKVLYLATAALLAGSSLAFAPSAPPSITTSSAVASRRAFPTSSTTTCLSMNLPFFVQQDSKKSGGEEDEESITAAALPDEKELDAMTMEDEIELLVQKELSKTKSMSKLRTSQGVEYAPWMGITETDERMIRAVVRDKTEARRKRQEQERSVSGNLYRDSQAQELSGTGLSYKIIDGEVELTWATKTEKNTKGFIVKRRAAKTNDYSVIASHQTYGPLMSKGIDGGIYRYLDSTATPGGWVYRISEEDNMGNESDVCQCLVEVETADEQKAAVIAGVGFGVVALAAFVAGIAMDPMNGY